MMPMNIASQFKSLPVQAQAVLAVGVISLVVLLAQMTGLKGDKKQFSTMVLAASLLAVLVSTYNIRCLISGNCNRWATLLAVAYVLTQGLALSAMF